MKQLHALSGSLVLLFVVFHLANHLTAWWGVAAHQRILEALRTVYRHPLGEGLLLAAVLFQSVSGVLMVGKYWRGRARWSGWFRLQVWSGVYLAFFFANHVGAVLVGRYVLAVDTNLAFATAGLWTMPQALFFWPYYSLGVMALFGHVAAVCRGRLKANGLAWLVIGFGGAVLLGILLGFAALA
ncbi:MAG: hypothetical protein AAFZ52_07815 [Bacteroidota bacterium]